MSAHTHAAREAGGMHDSPFQATETVGWQPSCACPEHDPIPCVVLDPFSGSGRTGVVALRLGRRYLGLELQPEYVDLSRRQISQDAPLWNGVTP